MINIIYAYALLILILLMSLICLVLSVISNKKDNQWRFSVLSVGLILLILVFTLILRDSYERKALSLLDEIKEQSSIVISHEDALSIIKIIDRGKDTEYLEVIIEEDGQRHRIYKALYRIRDGEVKFYKEQEEDTFIELK